MTTITKQDNSPLGALRSPLALTPALLALTLAIPADEAWGAYCEGSTGGNANNNRVVCGMGANASGNNAVAIGTNAKASGASSSAVGKGAEATKDYSTAYGTGAKATGDATVAIGKGAEATEARSIAVGEGAQAQAEGSMVFGSQKDPSTQTIASGKNSMAFSTGASASDEGAVAFGAESRATKAGAFAFGYQAQTTVEGSIAVGERSVASRDAGPIGYDMLTGGTYAGADKDGPVWKSTHAAHAVGNEAVVTRQVTGVAAGVEPTDGVNVAQLRRAREAIDNIHFYVRANGKTSPVYGDDTVHFVGDRNIHVDLNGQTVSINLDPNLKLESITINNGGPRMDKGGINMANNPITNLADGVAPHDAVNKGQLDDVDDNLRAGVATAVAQANVPQAVNPGANMLGFGVGHFRDQAALALGWSARSDNGRWVWRTDLGVNSDEMVLNNTIGYEF